MDIFIDYVGQKFVDINNNQVIYESLPPNTNIIWDGKIIKVTSSRGRPTNEWVKIYDEFKMAKTLKKLQKEKDLFLSYIPNNTYKFLVFEDRVELYENEILINITNEYIMSVDVNEMIYGILPAVICAVYPLMKDRKRIPDFFAKPEKYKPKVFKNGDQYIDDRVFALLHLILFFKKVVTKQAAKNFLEKYTSTSDVCHCYRPYAYGAGLYLLQSTSNEFSKHGFNGYYQRGSYVLWSLIENKPQVLANRDTITDDVWNDIKLKNFFKCDLCGSIEGQPHLLHPTCITLLEKGHIKPHLPLDATNCKPHCSHCNHKIKNNYFMDMYKNNEMAIYLNLNYIKSMYEEKEFDKICNDVKIKIYKKEEVI